MNECITRCWSRLAHVAISLLFVSTVNSCALLGKNEVLSPSYFSPEAPVTPSQAPIGDATAGAHTQLQLRLGRVSAAPYLGERIVFRESEYELGFYEERRWTEKPGAYLKRALSRSLFEEHGVRRIGSGPGPTLEVELTELAELRQTPPMARVRASYVLYDHRLVRTEETVTVELRVGAADPAAKGDVSSNSEEVAVVRAMSEALNGLVQRIVERVLAELQTSPTESQELVAPEPVSVAE